MEIRNKTKVKQSYEEVFAALDAEIFVRLAPPFPKVSLLKFEGCKKGDKIDIQLGFGLFKKIWKGEIVHFEHTAEHILFVDEGIQMPFGLKSWKHRHWFKKDGEGTIIEDHITYTTNNKVLDVLVYPQFKSLILWRKPVYKKLFS